MAIIRQVPWLNRWSAPFSRAFQIRHRPGQLVSRKQIPLGEVSVWVEKRLLVCKLFLARTFCAVGAAYQRPRTCCVKRRRKTLMQQAWIHVAVPARRPVERSHVFAESAQSRCRRVTMRVVVAVQQSGPRKVPEWQRAA